MFRCKWKEKPPLSLPGNPSRNWRLFSSCLLVSLRPSFVTIAQLTVNDPLCESLRNIHVQLVLYRCIRICLVLWCNLCTVTVGPLLYSVSQRILIFSGNDCNDRRRFVFLCTWTSYTRLKNGDKSFPFIINNKHDSKNGHNWNDPDSCHFCVLILLAFTKQIKSWSQQNRI